MAARVLMLGGAPGVGKSTVARVLLERLDGAIWLDGDDLWRMDPFHVNDVTRRMVERNIRFVLRSFVESGFRCVIFTWVLHRQAIIDSLSDGLSGLEFERHAITLTCAEAVLLARCAADPGRKTDPDLALTRLRQSLGLATTQIDTTGKTPGMIADEIVSLVGPHDMPATSMTS